MYHAEVLGKLPVMQHFLFGSILPFVPSSSSSSSGDEDDKEEMDDAHRGHAHTHAKTGGGASQHETGWGDCCGIPVPSVFAAAAAEAEKAKRGVGGNLGGIVMGGAVRPVPFD